MNTKSTDLTAERLRCILSYDAESGEFKRIVDRKRWKTGQVAGRVSAHGYIHICIDYKHYKAHRLAWLYVHGSFPLDEIDHINGNKSDNRLSNLRVVCRRLNEQNKHRAQSNNLSCGLRGVTFDKQKSKWMARLTSSGTLVHRSFHDTADLAYKSYLSAKEKHHKV